MTRWCSKRKWLCDSGPYLVPGALSGGLLKPRPSYGLFCFSGWFGKIGRVCLRWGWGEDIVKISRGGRWEGHSTQQCGILTFISNLHGLLWNKMAAKGHSLKGKKRGHHRSPQAVSNPINNTFLQVKFLCSMGNVLHQVSIIYGSVPGSLHLRKSGREIRSHRWVGTIPPYTCIGSFPSPYKFSHPW